MELAGQLAAWAVLAFGAAVAAPGDERLPVHVELTAPSGCSQAEAFWSAVLARTDRARRADAGEPGVLLRVELTRVGGRVRGELRVTDQRGETERRKVDGRTCAEVVEVLSLTAALALEPAAARPVARATPAAPAPRPASPGPSAPGASVSPRAGGPGAASSANAPTAPRGPAPAAPAPGVTTPAPSSAPAPPPTVAPVPAARASSPERVLEAAPIEASAPEVVVTAVPAQAAESSASPREYGLALGAQALGAAILWPYVSVGAGLSLRLTSVRPTGTPPSAGLAAAYAPRDAVLPEDRLSARWMAISIVGCPGWGVRSWMLLEACARASVGRLTATDSVVSDPRTATRSWWSVGVFARVQAPLWAGLAVELEAGLDVPVVERRFMTTTPEQTVASTPVVSPRAGLGLVYDL